MKEKDFNAWQKTRAKGALRFCLENGLLAWGLPMLILMAFVNKPFEQGLGSAAAMVHYITWPIAGVVFGAVVWWLTEKSYQRELAKRQLMSGDEKES